MGAEQSGTFEIGGDITVNRLGFGAMRITGDNIIGPPEDEKEARQVLSRAVELGVDFIDTADSYGPGVSERLIHEELHPYDESGVTVATKGCLMRRPDGEWVRNGDPNYLKNATLCSVDRLGVDTIDLYQLHRFDEDVPNEDSLNALAEMKDEGYINHIGLSEVTVEELEEARDTVEVATVQNRYNVGDREHDDVVEYCEENGIGFLPWFPLASGNLAAKEDALNEVAEAHDATMYQVALAWLLERSPVILPIPGTGSVDHLEENVGAAKIELTDEDMESLD
jgi:aryl-alcohol dehydrogenase-like predicted oxidoreductase